MEPYQVKQFIPENKTYIAEVPASKSILNRALILAALSRGTVSLRCGSYAEDTQALLECLSALGIDWGQEDDEITVCGCGGDIPNKNARLNVMSAGTAARFLTAALSFCGGEYTLDASEQMKKRPMEILSTLSGAGVQIEYLENYGTFPFRMRSQSFTADSLAVDTDQSTQYASGILMAATAGTRPFTLTLSGSRTEGSYIAITLKMLSDFGAKYTRKENEITVYPAENPPEVYDVEPDLSGACYFYALTLLYPVRVLVRRVKADSIQGDIKFLNLLQDRGVAFAQTEEGLLADGSYAYFRGFDDDFNDFSDQTLTAAAIAPFATTPSILKNITHIRTQESDRVAAIVQNLNALGVNAYADQDNIYIFPSVVRGGYINTYHDHRVAMSFALTGLKTGNITIDNPDCCKKTFANYFEIISSLTDRT